LRWGWSSVVLIEDISLCFNSHNRENWNSTRCLCNRYIDFNFILGAKLYTW
jgi:hypothetical protein